MQKPLGVGIGLIRLFFSSGDGVSLILAGGEGRQIGT